MKPGPLSKLSPTREGVPGYGTRAGRGAVTQDSGEGSGQDSRRYHSATSVSVQLLGPSTPDFLPPPQSSLEEGVETLDFLLHTGV